PLRKTPCAPSFLKTSSSSVCDIAIKVRTQAMVADTLGQLPALNARLNEAVSRERQTGMQMVQSVLE
ncbi:hypothetical protein O5472_26215, partial [Escherichia coli]|nr:hypothetical protein [Escherichia coli]